MNTPYVKITKTKGKQPFRLQEIAGNGELIGHSETYATRQGIRKNLLARLKLYGLGESMVLVRDYSYPGGMYEYHLYNNGRVNVLTPKPNKNS